MNDINVQKKVSASKNISSIIMNSITNHTLLYLLAIVLIFAIIYSKSFFTLQNLNGIIDQISILMLIAFGQTFVLIGGGIDLSVGSLLALSSILLGLIGPFDW